MTRSRRKWYVDFFREGFFHHNWAPAERFQRAEREVDFIVEQLGVPSGASVLDLCCGEGRHSVALARRGYRMSGLDLCALHLRLAWRAAKEAGVSVRWHRADMRDIPWEGEFDAVINVFTSFGYLESDDEDFKVLAGVAKALKRGGRFLLDTINREMLVRHWQEHSWQEGDEDFLRLEDRRFDLLAGRQHNRVHSIHPDGTRSGHEIDLRMYTLKELADMLSRAGLAVRRTWGGFDGRDYDLDSRRMIVLSEKGDVA
jgi:SAM-dependent methyltransferase